MAYYPIVSYKIWPTPGDWPKMAVI